MSRRAPIWVVTKVNDALVTDGVFEIRHAVTTYLASEHFHVEMIKQGGIDGLAFDPILFYARRIVA